MLAEFATPNSKHVATFVRNKMKLFTNSDTVQLPVVGTKGKILIHYNFQSNLLTNLLEAIYSFQKPFFASPFEVFASKKVREQQLSCRVGKLSVHFHVKDGPQHYFPHKGMLVFSSISESCLPELQTVRLYLEKQFNCTINFMSLLFYPNECSSI